MSAYAEVDLTGTNSGHGIRRSRNGSGGTVASYPHLDTKLQTQAWFYFYRASDVAIGCGCVYLWRREGAFG